MATSPSRLRAAPENPANPVGAPLPTRRSYPLIGTGLLAALVGALLFATISAGSDHRRVVLVVAHPVAAGDVISAGDLSTVKMNPGRGVVFMPAAAQGKVVGRSAAVALVPGSLLVPAQLGSPSGLADGQAAVGLLLEPGRYPPGLRSGDHVAVVSAPTGPVPATADSLRL
ncbi:MAG TPA: SAF domain-containing protein, partial [Acidimicrobiia bacterium]|nr:SAF domain-containing protein [Acidimicrobiia bacterium]